MLVVKKGINMTLLMVTVFAGISGVIAEFLWEEVWMRLAAYSPVRLIIGFAVVLTCDGVVPGSKWYAVCVFLIAAFLTAIFFKGDGGGWWKRFKAQTSAKLREIVQKMREIHSPRLQPIPTR